jgi:hypothetical protein
MSEFLYVGAIGLGNRQRRELRDRAAARIEHDEVNDATDRPWPT